MIYDYIVIGAGLGGLGAGLNLSVNGKKVLMLEKNSYPGGRTTTFKRGRFEFDTTLYDFYNFGNAEHQGEINRLFKRFGLNVETTVIPFNTKILALDTKETFEIKGNFEEFVVLLEELQEGSIEPVRNFIKVTKEIHEALEELGENNPDFEAKHPIFLKYLDVSAQNALQDLKIPKETIKRLGYFWLELGSPLNKLSFIDFAEFMYKIIFKRVTILNNKSLDLMIKLVKKYQNKGGKLYYNSEVIEIKEEAADLKVVLTKDGKEYKAHNIVCDLSPRYVFKNLIKNQNANVNRLENARTLAPYSLTVYIGLNANHEALNLNNYHYYQFETLNSEQNVSNMMSFNHHTWMATVPNVVNKDASPENTTILILKINYYTNIFDRITKENYYQIKESIASNLIDQFETAFKVKIRPFIEEIEVSTPITFARYTNSINGSPGYMRLGYDNAINRILSFNEESIPHISFVGSSSLFGDGADNAFYSGYYVTKQILKKEEAENGK